MLEPAFDRSLICSLDKYEIATPSSKLGGANRINAEIKALICRLETTDCKKFKAKVSIKATIPMYIDIKNMTNANNVKLTFLSAVFPPKKHPKARKPKIAPDKMLLICMLVPQNGAKIRDAAV